MLFVLDQPTYCLDENSLDKNRPWTKTGLDEKLWTKTGWMKTGRTIIGWQKKTKQIVRKTAACLFFQLLNGMNIQGFQDFQDEYSCFVEYNLYADRIMKHIEFDD